MLTTTVIILLVTCVTSFIAFSNQRLTDDLIFYPPAIDNNKQWYRFISSGFIHADIMHLAFNMYTLYSFGAAVESMFTYIYDTKARVIYIFLYLSALVVCLLPSYFKHRGDYYYRSLGASGAVSAVIFAGIFLNPTAKLMIFPLPFEIPGFIFGIIYLVASAYLSRKGNSNINHSAHIWGGIYGIVFLIITCQFMTTYRPLTEFVVQVKTYFK